MSAHDRPDIRRSTIERWATRPFPVVEGLGLRLVDYEPGHLKVLLPAEGNTNHLGIVYAGALFSAAEIPGGVLFQGLFDPRRFFPIVADMSISFLKPATSDVTVEGRLGDDEVERIARGLDADGKATFEISQELTDADGVVVATTTGRYQGRRV